MGARQVPAGGARSGACPGGRDQPKFGRSGEPLDRRLPFQGARPPRLRLQINEPDRKSAARVSRRFPSRVGFEPLGQVVGDAGVERAVTTSQQVDEPADRGGKGIGELVVHFRRCRSEGSCKGRNSQGPSERLSRQPHIRTTIDLSGFLRICVRGSRWPKIAFHSKKKPFSALLNIPL